ncbi:Mannan polymerase II complex ANP1 subunit like protein [Verticillium longisporum]|uniref:Mannan polymerase II complex ANP1 subunit like protein n=1 Tax=Verticillium longisporum TaxID=100787 RepID=A0A8I2ZFM5_VERLO|nr:Mannan polymerase II complex ANP1 subunit like protein [Verticillium longisporum]
MILPNNNNNNNNNSHGWKHRALAYIVLAGFVLLLWRGVSGRPHDRFYCWGPPKAPMDMTSNERAAWSRHLQTPVLFNPHKPIEVDSPTIKNVDMNPISSTRKAVANQEKVLILTPLKDAAPYLSKYFELISRLTYPHQLIDLAFLVGDSSDDTLAVLAAEADRLQKRTDSVPFRSITVVEKDFKFHLSQNVEERHSFEAQGPRRKALGRARNYLLSVAMKPDHSWVYWRDVDIVENPAAIIEDFIAHDVDIIVPNVWFHRIVDGVDIEGRFDYNSWIESNKGRMLANKLSKDVVLAEGYSQYKTGRTYMARMGDRTKNKDEEIDLDGIGGVNIIVKADVHRSGINFPCYAFENQAETEGFAKMAKRAGYRVVGLPNYVVWHIDTDEKPGNA